MVRCDSFRWMLTFSIFRFGQAIRSRRIARLCLLATVLVCLLFLVGACGGGGGELDDGIEEIEFADEPTAVPGESAGDVDVIGEFLRDTVVLLPDMEYLDTQSFYLGELQEVARDISSHIEAGEDDDIGLPWVVGVHRTVLSWDALQGILGAQDVSVEHRDRYGEIYVGMVESYYRLAFSADRLLGAAVILGPSGRTRSEMSLEEERRFRVLLNQASYFVEIADEKVLEVMTSVDDELVALHQR